MKTSIEITAHLLCVCSGKYKYSFVMETRIKTAENIVKLYGCKTIALWQTDYDLIVERLQGGGFIRKGDITELTIRGAVVKSVLEY